MHGNEQEFLASVSGFIGSYYLFVGFMNALAAFYLWQTKKAETYGRVPLLALPFTTASVWLLVSIFFVVIGGLALGGSFALLKFPQGLRNFLDSIMQPHWYTLGVMGGLVVLYLGRRFFVRPTVAWGMLNLMLLLMGYSMTDPDFSSIVTKPDNVPIVGMVYLLAFFTWLGAYKAVQNDDRLKQGLEPLEKELDEKVLVWPDLVYTELICMIAITALLIVWAVLLQAPLEEPASSVKTPNPSKAPWYFLGLQEMLVYYDPWMAGVVLPSVVVFGLMAIPFMDFNPKGNGYYTIDDRKFAYLMFQFGFLVLWVTLIVMGTFMRGPNWNFFGLYETWDTHKVEALNNIDLSEYWWVQLWGVGRPKAPASAGELTKFIYILWREAPGIILTILYFAALPPAMVIYIKGFRKMFVKMGFARFMLLAHLLLLMGLLPLKMVLRWTINMKYFISIPEYFLNF
ncbi:MAG: hypothetical protein MK165_07585 [Pirellulaceae bacterium]|nr:hypothetical protein [Pirellulaceae bacterium]